MFEGQDKKNINCFLCTQQKLISLLEKRDLYNVDQIIFDEDPLTQLMPMDSLDLKDYEHFKEQSLLYLAKQQNKKQYNQLYAELISVHYFFTNLTHRPNCIVEHKEYPVVGELDNLLQETPFGHLVERLLSSHFIVFSILENKFWCIKKNLYPDFFDKDSIILSATADEYFYKKLFEEEDISVAKVTDIQNRKPMKQNIHQFFFKSYLKKNGPGVIPKIEENTAVITYKQFKNYFPPECFTDLHFGNTEGIDVLRGKNLVVLGTADTPFNRRHAVCKASRIR